MSKYRDVEKFIESYQEELSYIKTVFSDEEAGYYRGVETIIDTLNLLDAEEDVIKVIYCQDCKHNEHCNFPFKSSNGYCSHAERKEENQ